MDDEKLNNLIRIAKEHYQSKKYKKARSVLGKIRESDFLGLDEVRQMDYILLTVSILAKLKRYFESFNLVKGLFADIPHKPDLILKSRDLLSDEGFHKYILGVLVVDTIRPKTERQEILLNMISNVTDTSEKGRFLIIFFYGMARQEDKYFNHLIQELYKFFPNNTFLNNEVEREESQKEEMRYIKLYNSGTQLLQNEDYENAINYFEDAYAINPNDIELLGNLGVSHMSLGNFNNALRYYTEALKINPNHITILFNKGVLLSMQAEYDKAIKTWEKLLSYNPDFYQAKCMISQVIKQRDSFMRLEPQSDQYPESALNLFNKGKLYLHQGKISEAVKVLKEAVNNTPDFSESLALLGLALWEDNQFDEAMRILDKSLELNRNILIAWNTKGMLLDRQKKYKEAIECYDKALKINPDCSAVLNNKGLALDMMNNYDHAIECYNQSLKLNPYFSGAWINKAATLKKKGLSKSALDCYKEALKLNPKDKNAQQEFDRLNLLTSLSPSKETIEIQIDSNDYCPRCGEKNYSNSSLCPYCGTQMGKKPSIAQKPDLLSSMASADSLKETFIDFFQKYQEQDSLAKTDADLKRVDDFIEFGRNLVGEGRFEDAIKYFEDLLEEKHSLSDFKGADSWKWSRIQRKFEEVYALIGYCQEQVGEFKNALENFKFAFGKVITIKGEKISVNDLVERRIKKWVEEAVLSAYSNNFEQANKIYEEIPGKVQLKQFLSTLDIVIKENKIPINYSQFPNHLEKQDIDEIITIYKQICLIISSAFSVSPEGSLFSLDVYKALLFLRELKPEVSSAKVIKQKIVDAYMASKDIDFKSIYKNLMNSKFFS